MPKWRAKAFVFMNGKLDMHRVLPVDKWLGKDLKPVKDSFTITYPTKVMAKGTVDIECTPAYISVFSARNGQGLYMTVSLFNPIFNKVKDYPLKTLADAADPMNLTVPYA